MNVHILEPLLQLFFIVYEIKNAHTKVILVSVAKLNLIIGADLGS